MASMIEHKRPSITPLREIAFLFLKLGITAFGGPAAHIGLMHTEVVQRRRWLNDQEFLDLLGATNLIPGPNSTEMAIHIGYQQAGGWGLLVAGVCFILPAMLMVTGLAWAYVRFGTSPAAAWLLVGIKPVMMAIIGKALWDLGQKAMKGWWLTAVGFAVCLLYFAGINEIGLLFGGSLVVMLGTNWQRWREIELKGSFLPLTVFSLPPLAATAFSLPLLFFTFLKIGSVLYGSGYVLFAFMRADFVTRLGWLTDQQLLDAIAIGQVTPGPLFTTATFVGYLLGGPWGALWATVGIFLPSFVFVAVSQPLIPRLRQSVWVSGLLDGANAASLGLMTAVTVELGQASLIDPFTILIALISLFLLVRFKINATWLIFAGALASFIRVTFS